MSEIKVNKLSPRTNCGTVQLGDSGDTITIPAGATITNNGTAAGFGSTGEVSWNTTKITADPGNAVSGVGYFTDTSSAAFNVTLPASPSAGNVVAVADYANNWGTNNLTILRNGSNIEGSASDFVCNTNGASITFVYVDATKGWIATNSGNSSDAYVNDYVEATGGTILISGDFKTHVFTGPGTFIVCSAGNPAGSTTVEYLVVAGGGSAGSGDNGGGAGAGGYRQNYPSPVSGGLSVTTTAYPITVGGGGAAVSGGNRGNNGNNSIFSSITSTGGGAGGGGSGDPGDPLAPANPGGSGGGGAWNAGSGGTGNTPPVSPPQGNSGGSNTGGAPFYGSGGGGGAGGGGSDGAASSIGNGGGGSPIATTFFGPTAPSYGTPGPAAGRYFGGGAAGNSDSGTSGSAGAGGGGLFETDGGINTGGGGGASNDYNTSGGGGSGIVVIRYKFQ